MKKLGWNVDLLGQVASYDTAIAEAPGNVAEGFYSMSPSLYAYPDDPRPAVKAFMQKYKARYGVEANYLGEMGYTSAQIAIEALQRAGRDLTVDSLVKAMESIQDYHDLFGGTYSFSADQPSRRHGGVPVGGAQRPLGAGGGSRAGVLGSGRLEEREGIPDRWVSLRSTHPTGGARNSRRSQDG